LNNPQSTQSFDSDFDKETVQQLQVGTNLTDRYLVQAMLGVGGMSAVYRARDMHFPNVTKLVAVKEMINRALDPVVRSTIVRNFEREANLLASLDHRAIPRIYDYFTLNERSYLIIEFINGRDLEALVSDSDDFIPEERILRWAIELCEVLSYLHNHKPEPIIFRDMKPSNVMINSQDHVVLVDFGIAKTFQVGKRGTMIGTEGYSPPEQYRGEASPMADIYALGATLHHALTKRDPRLEPPFSFIERPIREINPNVSTVMEKVINKALEYNPEDRFNTAGEMKASLMGVAQETGFLQDLSPNYTHINSSGDVSKAIWEFKTEDEVRGNLSYHNGVVYAGCYDNNLYALDANLGKFIWKYPTDGGIVSKPAIYEDSIFVGSEDDRLHAVYLRTGRVNWTYFTKGPIRSSPFIAEGHIFIGSDDRHIHAVNAATGRPAWRQDAGAAVRSTPLVVDDLVYFGAESGDFYCLDFSGTVKWRFKAKRAITSTAVIFKGIVYFGSVDSTVYAIDAKTGWVIWRFRLDKPTISSPYIHDNLLFIGSIDGSIYCIDITNSKEQWRFDTQHQVTGSPIIHKDSLYCGSVDGYLYCLEYGSGRLRWKFRTNGAITGTPVAWEDMVYIGSTDHKIYALQA
jgi:outer membrane protein assembly factor BamB/tRNA A-37 threonylcarbamoyl transferase component Bud32